MHKNEIQLWPDKKLLELIYQGDRSAFEIVYNKYWSKLYLAAYNLLRDRQISEDIVQEVLVSLWIRRENVEINSLNAFLYTAIKYKVFKVIRWGKVREDLFDEVEALAIDNETENIIAGNDLKRLLDENVVKLPDKCRLIFTLSRKEQLSTNEIAARLGIAPKTVENQLTIALRRLRSSLGDFLIWYFILLLLF